ncbi:hypothetical protein AJ79_08109 [Helicocarpus griseus UAMH5409]|uniref:Phospholipase A2 n=1 Tax=Helicocarpus griseus UAMH5409 TaxID=1447875 RepID=A0A2B7WWA7_9EURO|nr:hypothetical protein AJ79_08109 [Helicocarpus griseus UAMH5409]
MKTTAALSLLSLSPVALSSIIPSVTTPNLPSATIPDIPKLPKLPDFLKLPNLLPRATPSGSPSDETDKEATDRLLFSSTIGEFENARDEKDPPSLDWSSDGCSHSPDNPGYDYLPSCHRHDFGYRNYKDQDRFSDSNKEKIDKNFRDDMYNQCEQDEPDKVDDCKRIADIYYWAVSRFGKRDADAMPEVY